MPKHFWSLFLLCVLTAHTALAHPEKAWLKSYKKAKKQYDVREYDAAKATLAPLIASEEPQHALTPYALFYYALAAYYTEDSMLAEEVFNGLAVAFPDWHQNKEVWYWLGQLRCEAQDYLAGWAYFHKVDPDCSDEAVHAAKQYFLGVTQDLSTLHTLHKQYPQDPVVAQALFDNTVQQPLIKRDFHLLGALQRDFVLNTEAGDPLKDVTSQKKDIYNVAVFFPFFVDEVDYEEELSHQFVISLYQGIQEAVTTLAEQGIQINLFAYDTKKDPTTTTALLEQPEIQGMDLIIGPLYAATIPLVTEFAQRYQINLFNPLSENAEVVGKNPFVFLFRPSLETQARKAAEFTWQSAKSDANVGVIYGTTLADSIQAQAYQRWIEQLMGKEVALMLPVAPEEAQNFLKLFREAAMGKKQTPEEELAVELDEEQEEELAVELGEEQEEELAVELDEEQKEEACQEDQKSLNLESLTHIYVASKDALIATNVLSAIAMMALDPCIIGHEAWIQKNALTVDQLRRLPLRLIAPNYINYERAEIYAFRKRFYDRFACYPDHYACTGYEMMLFLGAMLSEHGTYFQQHWGNALKPGAIFSGAAYGIHHDNQQVPIVQFRNGVLDIIPPQHSQAPAVHHEEASPTTLR
ncbi:MAG: hypothetical protein AAFQ78_00225 [Bacteroidota bacterium]